MGRAGLPVGRHRLPGGQTAGDRRGARRTGAHARARAEVPGRPHAGAKHRCRRLRESPPARARDDARGARSDGPELLMTHAVMTQAVQATIPTPVSAIRIRGALLTELPPDLYIPPDALEVFFDTFEGPLDLLLYLIRKANIDILDIPMARLAEQYLEYV